MQPARMPHHAWINTNSGAGWHPVFFIDRLQCLAAQVGNLARSVFPFKGREVHHRDRELQPLQFGGRFDAALRK